MDRIYFVYGTLRPGGRYWPNVETYVADYEPAFIQGFNLFDLPEGYPAITTGEGTVFGDILFVRSGDERVMQGVVDEIEGYDERDEESSLYLRRTMNVTSFRKSQKLPAAIYVYQPLRQLDITRRGTLVACGDWREFTARSEA